MSEQENDLPVSESFIITIIGLLSACCGGFLTFILKSRCSTIKFCGCEIKREVVKIDPKDITIQTKK